MFLSSVDKHPWFSSDTIDLFVLFEGFDFIVHHNVYK
uniref:Uncharacterized protein n=1 Tax=Arundo donax TaxID=35708 RepID=A0A0A9HIL2_ARUDO